MNIDILRKEFGSRPFKASEARVALGTGAKMALSRLVMAGRLERVGRGVYRVAEPAVKERIDASRFGLLRREALRAPFQIALDGPDAVAAWTGGRYTVAPAAPGERVLWLAVAKPDSKAFREWLATRGWTVGTAADWPMGRGPKVILRRLPRVSPTKLDGLPVISRAAVLRLIKSEPVAYQDAEEWLLEG